MGYERQAGMCGSMIASLIISIYCILFPQVLVISSLRAIKNKFNLVCLFFSSETPLAKGQKIKLNHVTMFCGD
jgi:hypothetical protein